MRSSAFKQCLKWLKDKYPIPKGKRVVIRFYPMDKMMEEEAYSFERQTDYGWLVGMCDEFTPQEEVDNLLHFWPHILTWNTRKPQQDHTLEWQRLYGKLCAEWEAIKGNP
jgi:hypothetical protein